MVESNKPKKVSNQQIGPFIDLSKQSGPLGLSLSKTPALLHFIQTKLNRSRKSTTQIKSRTCSTKMEKTKKNPLVAEKFKASNFSIAMIKIGSWKVESRRSDELTAKFYFAKRKLVWEVLEQGLKRKIEIQWSEISAIRASFPAKQPGILELELSTVPLFFQETDPQPRKHTLWHGTSDFTGDQAIICRRHYLRFPEGTLEKHYEKLIQSDNQLFMLSQREFPSQSSPYFNSNPCDFQDLPQDFNEYQLECSSRLQVPYLGIRGPTQLMPVQNYNNGIRHRINSLWPPYAYQQQNFPYQFDKHQFESPPMLQSQHNGVQMPTSTPPNCETPSTPSMVTKVSASPISVNNAIKRQRTSLCPPYVNVNGYQNQDISCEYYGHQLQSPSMLQVPYFADQRFTSTRPQFEMISRPFIDTEASVPPISVKYFRPTGNFNNDIRHHYLSSPFNSNPYQNQYFSYGYNGNPLPITYLGAPRPAPVSLDQIHHFTTRNPTSAMSVLGQGIQDDASIHARNGGQVRELAPIGSSAQVSHFHPQHGSYYCSSVNDEVDMISSSNAFLDGTSNSFFRASEGNQVQELAPTVSPIQAGDFNLQQGSSNTPSSTNTTQRIPSNAFVTNDLSGDFNLQQGSSNTPSSTNTTQRIPSNAFVTNDLSGDLDASICTNDNRNIPVLPQLSEGLSFTDNKEFSSDQTRDNQHSSSNMKYSNWGGESPDPESADWWNLSGTPSIP